jgi:hypothetical protein
MIGEPSSSLDGLATYVDKTQDLYKAYWIDRPAPGFVISHLYDPYKDRIISCIAKPLGDNYKDLQIRYLNINHITIKKNETWLYYKLGLSIYVYYVDNHFIWLIN